MGQERGKGPLNIIYEDASIIVADKPAGLATQSANVAQQDLVSLVRAYLQEKASAKSGQPYLGIIHRLDQPVTGLVAFAKNQKAAAALSAQVKSDIMNKHYLAVVEGKVDAAGPFILKDLIYKDPKTSKAVKVDNRDSVKGNFKLQEAVLEYQPLKYYEAEDATLLDIRLVTGRFHQIRCQLSGMGHPIINDRKYGAVKSYASDFTGRGLIGDREIIGTTKKSLEFAGVLAL